MRLCKVRGCVEPGWHSPGCAYQARPLDCRGCQPRPAAKGTEVCGMHREVMPADARRIPEVYDALELQLVPAGQGMTETVSATPDRGLKLNYRAVDARANIEAGLSQWVELIALDRQLTAPGPGSSVGQLASYVANHAEWLTAQAEYGPLAVEAMRGMAWGEPWRIAYPAGGRTLDLPHPCPHEDCDGTLSARLPGPGSRRRAAVVCDRADEHSWTSEEWIWLEEAARRKAAA